MKAYQVDKDNGITSIDGSKSLRLVSCYSYIIQTAASMVLIDPGPAEDFPSVFGQVSSQGSIEKLSYILLTSESPTAASSLPLWQKAGFSGKVVLSWQAYISARYYAPGMDYHTISSRNDIIPLADGRNLRCIPLPGLPTMGAQVYWDPASASLFSGSLFGTLKGAENAETVVDGPQLQGRMESYHELFLSRSPAKEEIELLKDLGPGRICPHHGKPIVQDLSVLFTRLLQQSTEDSAPVSRENPALLRNTILHRMHQHLKALFPRKEVENVSGSIMENKEEGLTPEEFNAFFERILHAKGYTWLALIDLELRRLCRNTGIALPELYHAHEKEIAGGMHALIKEVRSLRDSNFQLQQSIIEASDDLLRDKTTGLYNESFFSEYIASTLQGKTESKDAVLFIRLDEIKTLNARFGAEAGDTTLKNLSFFLMNRKRESAVFFRLNGPGFAAYLHDTGKEGAVEYAEELKTQVERSDEFITSISISAAVIELNELFLSAVPADRFFTEMMKLAKERTKILERMGPGSICASSRLTRFQRSRGTILLIESSNFEAEIYRKMLEHEGFEVFLEHQGTKALEQADTIRPDIIISEIFVSQMDGFQIRRRLLDSQDLKEIPFILLSREKSATSVQRGFEMRVYRHFRKPVMPAELIGTVQSLIEMKERNV
ncbi:diguanylate cyclase domain-containing protein [Marispirochaeta sp.]|uniref:diguanylate cyclase domain-containing protein n=1 Tax=Marispirochaeta sp. TaxID=2038653 RepID=UPI0029C84B1D|nr:diguanylate cyclase [Marispirochaeta sp.]